MENRPLPVVAQLILLFSLALPVMAAEPAGTPEQVEDWNLRLDKARGLQAEGQARQAAASKRYAEEDAACYRKFFVNACRNGARETYLGESREGKRLETEGRAIERQVKKEQVAEQDRLARDNAPQHEAELQSRERETQASRQAAEQQRDATLADKARQAEEGARRKAENEERLRQKQQAHDARVAAKMEEARRKAAADAKP